MNKSKSQKKNPLYTIASILLALLGVIYTILIIFSQYTLMAGGYIDLVSVIINVVTHGFMVIILFFLSFNIYQGKKWAITIGTIGSTLGFVLGLLLLYIAAGLVGYFSITMLIFPAIPLVILISLLAGSQKRY